MLFDTSFLVDLLRGSNPEAKQKASEFDSVLMNKAVSSITVLELWRGALRSHRTETEMKRIDELLRSFLVYPVDEEAAKKAAEIEARLIAAGQAVEFEDVLIAAVAVTKDLPLLTKNVKHFEKIHELHVETY